ncbi:hypothetical protein LSTR_LSTR010849 [Laodelphax striatellus]|uniref:5'-3' exoribonuclease 1 n=1 Tax=Laodelphax striatellus TaxID=195883 RepID=A0A482WS34_LAOST|nr:hypothetical protein LSTR_LSTR010849 [Laodelphax striatellus]
MGVPKFFRYISERYPCLSEIVREYQIPEFDNLYLDMNGIIHVCSHPNDFDPHFRISEENIFKDIFNYIETLFRMIQPKKLFFLAVDGVAPRAKMNQQRGRRFKSAKEAETLEKQALAKGEKLPDVERFDSNCITPGTAFMARLQTELKHWITYKINSDKIWRKPTVILSGHETPGEGEHKIMDYIRFLKSKRDYDNNTRHCLYGLDADLIMLGLCSHEPHFSLLREEVKFSKNAQKKRSNAPEEITFFLLHLSLMREYIELEFQQLKQTLKFGFDLEKIIDDWVLMGFLVGNDFIPHLPHLHIANGALPILYQAYIDVLPTLDGYINENGTLNLIRFQKYMERLSNFDYNTFKDHFTDLKYFEQKTGRKASRLGEAKVEYSQCRILDINRNEVFIFLQYLGDEVYYSDLSDEDDDNESSNMSSMMKAEFSQHKSDYYKSKMEFSEVTQNVLQSQAECYVRAIQWNLNYYYNGCCSWSWFYPHHYAPYMSDIRNFADFKLDFDLGEPFLPFQQLLAVLPAGSKKLLPEPFQELMVDVDSPIIDFYPIDFETDLNGKRQDWEAVVLIPFIDEKKLLKAMEPRYDRLTDEEKRRNCHGPMHLFNYTLEDLGTCELPESFPTIKNNHVEVTTMYREDLYVERSKLTRGLCQGVNLDTYFPGFPTLRHLKFMAKLEKGNVMVFEQPSRGENMILSLSPRTSSDIKKLANAMLDQVVHVGWPHLREARVRAVSDGEQQFSLRNIDNERKELVEEKLKGGKRELWLAQGRTIGLDYKRKRGVEVGETDVIIYASFLEGKKYLYLPSGKVTTKKQWETVPTPFALQTVVEKLKVHEDVKGRELTIGDIFKPGGFCFLLATKFYGDMGLIDPAQYDGKIKLTICHTSEPDFRTAKAISQKLKGQYVSGAVLGNKLGLTGHLLSRITGSIFISKDASEDARKVNVGLNLKFNRKNQEVCGYTKRLPDNKWLYSPKAEELLIGYLKVASDLIKNLSSNVGNDVFLLEDVFPENGEKRLSEITSWLKESTSKLTRQNCGSDVLDEEVINILEKTVDVFESPETKTSIIQCKPQLLVLPLASLGRQCPDPAAEHKLFDRVRSIRESYMVPLGMKGTIVGIHQAEKECDTSYDILYDKEFPGGLSLNGSGKRCCRALKQSFINLSHGQRMANAKQQQQTNDKPRNYTHNQESSYANTTARNGKNSSAFVSCHDSKEYKNDEETPFHKALLRNAIKFVPAEDQSNQSNKPQYQNETQRVNNPVKLLTRPSQNEAKSYDPPSDQLRKMLKINEKPQNDQNQSPRKPLLDSPYTMRNHFPRQPLLQTPPTRPNFALGNTYLNVVEGFQMQFPHHQVYNNVPQQNYNWPGAPAFVPHVQQMIPRMHHYQQVRMNDPPPPPFQWYTREQPRLQQGRRGGAGGGGIHQKPTDVMSKLQLDQIQMQPSRWQREVLERNASFQNDQGQAQYSEPYQNDNRYQFSQSWSGNPNSQSHQPLNRTPSHSQGQANKIGMQNAPAPHHNPQLAARPQSSNQERKWRLACNFKNTPEFK